MSLEILEFERQTEAFCDSALLHGVVAGLAKLVGGKPLEDSEKKILEDMGDLFGQMDWYSEQYKRNEHPELRGKATDLRPLFYREILNLSVQLKSNGIHFLYDKHYSNRIYETLKSGGRTVALAPNELAQVQLVFNSIQKAVLTSIDHNGHPNPIF
jgi:hypothetical protein